MRSFLQLCTHPPAPAGKQWKVFQTFKESKKVRGGSGGEEPKTFPRWAGNKASFPHAQCCWIPQGKCLFQMAEWGSRCLQEQHRLLIHIYSDVSAKSWEQRLLSCICSKKHLTTNTAGHEGICCFEATLLFTFLRNQTLSSDHVLDHSALSRGPKWGSQPSGVLTQTNRNCPVPRRPRAHPQLAALLSGSSEALRALTAGLPLPPPGPENSAAAASQQRLPPLPPRKMAAGGASAGAAAMAARPPPHRARPPLARGPGAPSGARGSLGDPGLRRGPGAPSGAPASLRGSGLPPARNGGRRAPASPRCLRSEERPGRSTWQTPCSEIL